MLRVIFSRPKKFKLFSWMIMKWQDNTDYSHASIFTQVEDKNVIIESSYGKVHLTDYDEWLDINIETESFTKRSLTKETQSEITFEALSHIDKPYGFATVVGIVLYDMFGWTVFDDNTKSFTCSEFVYHVLRKYNLVPEVPEPEYIKPIQLLELMKSIAKQEEE